MDHHDHHNHHHVESDSMTTTILPNVTTMVVNALVNASSLITAPAQAMHHAEGGHDGHHMTTSGHVHDGHDDNNGHGQGEEDHSEHGTVGGHMMMDMTFHFGSMETILFKEWAVSSVGGMVGSVIGIFLIALLYEGLKFLREYLYREHFNAINYSSVSVMGHDGKTVTELHKVTKNRVFGWPHLLQTSLHIAQVLVSYFLMLIFMTYNVWLCLAVLLGSGLGYFFFGWRKATIVDISEHCH